MAKNVIHQGYGRDPDRSYFAGCSNGGRHAMVAATRYANDYDGILVGSPGYRLPLAAVASIAGARYMLQCLIRIEKDLKTAFTLLNAQQFSMQYWQNVMFLMACKMA